MQINYQQITDLANKYNTPLYLYDQNQLIENINTIKSISTVPNIQINYATKANNNLELLKIIHEQELGADCTGFGEYYLNRKAGFTDQQTYAVANNLTSDELTLLANEQINISVDSIDQLHLLQQVAPNYQHVMIRVNPSFGAGENESIITGGNKHKFGIDIEDLDYCIKYIQKNSMGLVGINQHIGSLNLDYKTIIEAVNELVSIISQHNLTNLDVINFGGGFGIDYTHQTKGLDFTSLSTELDTIFTNFLATYPNKEVSLQFEPGRYLVANTSVLVGIVTSIKKRGSDIYIGTNLGFSQLVRPTMYNSYHHVEFITENKLTRHCHVVGNMCESGDYIAKDRKLIVPEVGDLVIVHDTGAYGYSMASNFNNRLRPAEVLICSDNSSRLIRRRETVEDLLATYEHN